MKNKKLLFNFVWYFITHPEQRFWQALRNWSNTPFIYKSDRYFTSKHLQDTFYKETK